MARAAANTPCVRSRAPGQLPKLGVEGSNPFRRSFEGSVISDVSESLLAAPSVLPLGMFDECRLTL